MPIITARDIKIHYELIGEKEPMLLLHGNGGDGHYFDTLCTHLKENFQCITMDMRGHGLSTMGNKALCYETISEDIKILLDTLAYKKVHILGFSDGANAAMYFASQYPSYVNTLILNGGNLNPHGIETKVQIPVVLGYWSIIPFAWFSKNAKDKKAILNLMVHHPHIDETMINRIVAPALVIVGNHDMVKQEHSMHIANMLQYGEFKEIEGTHFIARDACDTFYEAIMLFLNKHM